MCEPSTGLMIASLAFSALSTGVSYVAEKENAKAMQSYQNEVAEQNTKNAQEAYRFNVAQETTRMMQEEASTSTQIQQATAERRRATGEAIASSTAAGLSLEALQEDFMRQEGNFKSLLTKDLEWKQQQSRENMKGFQAQTQDRIASYNPAPVQKPSAIAALAGLGTKTIGIYSDYRNNTKIK